ncbi:MAG: helix-turn-helix domain-containing protein [Myxococcota bacterium]
MPKTYHQRCMVAKALDLVGERWTLLIVRDLLLGGRRYSDLLQGLPGLTTNLLAQRLQRLTAEGLVERRELPAPAAATVYELTALGQKLEPVVLSLGTFGETYMHEHGFGPLDPSEHKNARWAMVSLKRRYRGSPRTWTLALWVGALPFTVVIGGEAPTVRDGTPTDADITVRGDPGAWVSLLYGGGSSRELVAAGALERNGSARALADFSRAFGMRP